jgi:hypothetical protein
MAAVVSYCNQESHAAADVQGPGDMIWIWLSLGRIPQYKVQPNLTYYNPNQPRRLWTSARRSMAFSIPS